MTHEPLTSTRAIAERVKELRGRRGWTAAELGKRMTRLGFRWDRSIVANLETGRRTSVRVAELLALAYILEVAPVDLLVPPDGDEDGEYAVAPTVASTVGRVRTWVTGDYPLPGLDPLLFRMGRPRRPWQPSDEEREAYLREVYRLPEGRDRIAQWIDLTGRHIEDQAERQGVIE